MGNQHGYPLGAGYDVPSSLPSRHSRKAAFAAYRAAAKSDRRLMQETQHQLSCFRSGLRQACLTPFQRKALVAAFEDGIDDGRQRLATAAEAGERLLRLPHCPANVERQLHKLQRACSELEHLLLAMLAIVDASSASAVLRLTGPQRDSQLAPRNINDGATTLRIGEENQRRQTSRRPEEFVRTPLTEDNAETVTEYYRVHDRVMRFVKPEHGMNFSIKSIEKIVNRPLERRMYQFYGQLLHKDCVPELYFHGTTGAIAEKIIHEGFKVGSHGMYGAGIYFATDTTKGAQYSRDNGEKSLLVCEVLLGRSMVLDGPSNSLTYEAVRAAGYDSVFAKRNTKGTGGVLNDEYVVYRPEQASPRYLVKFTT